MKKFILAILFLSLFIKNVNTQEVYIDNKRMDVIPMNLEINQKKVESDLPIFAYNDTTYVPVRLVSEKMGYKVIWVQETKTVGIKNANSSLWLPVGKNVVRTDEGLVEIPNGAKALFVKLPQKTDMVTYVPVRFLSEYMKKNVEYDANTKTAIITDDSNIDLNKISEENKNSSLNQEGIEFRGVNFITEDTTVNKVELIFDKSVKYKLEKKDNIINLFVPNAHSNQELGNMILPLLNVSSFNVQETTEGILFTINLLKDTVNIHQGDQDNRIYISDSYYSDGVSIVEHKGEKYIKLSGLGKQKYNRLELSNPKRLIVDFYDTIISGNDYQEYNVSLNFIKSVRMSQFVPDANYKPEDKIVRVVFDINEDVAKPDLKIITVGDDLLVKPEKSIYDHFSFRHTGTGRFLTFKNTTHKLEYNYDTQNNIVTIYTDNKDLTGTANYNDNIVKKLEVKNGIVNLYLIRKAIINESFSNQGEFTLSFNREFTGSNSDFLIMIDPGHGGTDPGAISPIDGTSEKDVILPVQRALEQQLKNLGYNVVKTNHTVDSYVPVKERAKLANELKPDLFISIHANSSENKSARGIEVLYCDEKKCKNKEPYQKELAEIVLSELEKITHIPTRGLKLRPEIIVVGKTESPAILVEMGFLTDKEENRMMKDPQFQQKMVEALVRAIERYLREYRG